MKTTFKLNGKKVDVETEEGAALLWTLRENLHMTGSKYGCGAELCGACTVLIDGEPTRSCTFPMEKLKGKEVTTIEGLTVDERLHPLQKAWIDEQVPQCGYCQSGQIMQAVALLNKNPHPTRAEIKRHMHPILCRCGAYMRILKAIEKVATQPATKK